MKNGPQAIEINAQKGIRNDVFQERFEKGDLAIATNIELDETGKIYRRAGVTEINATASHSLWAEGGVAYIVQGGFINLILPDLSLVPVVPVSGSRVSYKRVLNDVFWSDGISSGVLTGATNRAWGVEPPPQLNVTATTGDLLAGTYLVTMTYVRSDEHESGAPLATSITVPANSGLHFPNLPISTNPLVDRKRLYASNLNGEALFAVGTIANSATTATITAINPSSLSLRTSLLAPPPVGDVIGYYKGRTFVAKDGFLWYSRAYEHELFDLMEDYVGFSSPVRTFAPVTNGIFVGTETETVFLAGDSPTSFVRHPVADYGTVLGTEYYVPGYYAGKDGGSGVIPFWMSKRGVCTGRDGGGFSNLTGGRYVLPDGVSAGASLLKVRGGTPQFVTSLFG